MVSRVPIRRVLAATLLLGSTGCGELAELMLGPAFTALERRLDPVLSPDKVCWEKCYREHSPHDEEGWNNCTDACPDPGWGLDIGRDTSYQACWEKCDRDYHADEDAWNACTDVCAEAGDAARSDR